MKIEHIAMYVADLEREKAFFEKYFNAISSELYYNRKTGFSDRRLLRRRNVQGRGLRCVYGCADGARNEIRTV